MNTQTTSTPANVASAILSAARYALTYGLITNGSSSDRWYVIVDSATVPTLFSTGSLTTGIRSPRIPAGQTWRVLPLDSTHVAAFDNGATVLSFGSKADGSPDYTQLSAADMSGTFWGAALA